MTEAKPPLTHLHTHELQAWTHDVQGQRPAVGEAGSSSCGLEPLHVFYGSAARFHEDTFQKMRRLATDAWQKYFSSPAALAALGDTFSRLSAPDLARLHSKIATKLQNHPIDNFRIDFEDGLGPCDDTLEDGLAQSAATALHVALANPHTAAAPFAAPRRVGIRIKALTPTTAARALRTLDVFISAWASEQRAKDQTDFVVTVPKVESVQEVQTICRALERLEERVGLPADTIGLELMVESPALLFTRREPSSEPNTLEGVLHAGGARVRGVHFGVYDYLAAANISAPHQRHDHPLAQRAREELVLRTLGTSCQVSDGASHEMPIGPHRATSGSAISAEQEAENREVVFHALRIHHDNVRRALDLGLCCGWDLHPAQLIARWAATLHFLQEGLPGQLQRAVAYLQREGRADRTGAFFDDAASAQGVFHFFRRGWLAGAIVADDLAGLGCTPLQIDSLLVASGIPTST